MQGEWSSLPQIRITNTLTASFTFSGDDGKGSGVASFQCQLNGGGWSACNSPQDYTLSADGAYTFEVYAIDNFGWGDLSPAQYPWLVDSTPPTTTITSNPPDPSDSDSASFDFSGGDPGGSGVAGFECNLDNSGWVACTSSKIYTGLSEGSHTFKVRAVDLAGNYDLTPAEYTWVVDAIKEIYLPLVMK